MVDITKLTADVVAKRQGEAEKKNISGSNEAFDNINPGEFFIRNVGESVTNLFGAEKSDFTKAGERQHPKLAIASELAGTLVPYLGTAKLSKLGKYGKLIDKIGDAEKSPFSTGAMKSAARFAPLEGARVGAALAFNPENAAEVAQSAAFNTLIEAGLGSIGGAVSAVGKVDKKVPQLFGNLKDSTQIQMRELSASIANGGIDPAYIPKAKNQLTQMKNAILSEELVGKGRGGIPRKYIESLQEDGDLQAINRLFKASAATAKTKLVRRRLISSSRDFGTSAEAKAAIEAAGLTDNLDSVQFPRFLKARDKPSAKTIEDTLIKRGKFVSAVDNLLYQKEQDGLFVLAKKTKGELGKKNVDDQWVMFKTDNPQKFSPKGAAWAKQIENRTAFLQDVPRAIDPANPLDIYDDTIRVSDALPFQAFKEAETTGALGKGATAIANKLGLSNATAEVRKRGGEFVREYFAPAMHQFKGNPRAKYIHGVARATYDKAREMSRGIVYGTQIGKDKSLLKQTWRGLAAGGKFKGKNSIKNILAPLGGEDITSLLNAWEQQLSPVALTRLYEEGGISEKAFNALKQIDEIDNYMVGQIKETQKATGQKQLTALKGHHMLSRTWEGDWRVPLTNDNNRITYVASGKTRAGAQSEAERIAKEAAGEGLTLKPSKAQIFDTDQDIELAHQLQLGSAEYQTAAAIKSKIRIDAARPKTFKARTGVGGYKSQFTKEELLEKFHNHLQSRNKYMADLSVNDLMQSELMKLSTEDPKLARDLSRRLGQLSGRQGELAQKQNQVVDAVMAPVMGKNSASKISGSLNSALYHLQLGMGNLAFPIVNAMTFVQTVLPRMAFLSSATDDTLMRHLSWYPANGSRAKPVGGMGVMDAFKMMKNSMKEMGNPDTLLTKNFNKAVNDGTIDPKFIEEALGSSSKQATSFKEILNSGSNPFSKLVDSISAGSSYMPGLSEKFARGQAFTTGHMVGRDWFNLTDDALYKFSKEFTEQTMFNYGTADRARVMTAPMGRFFGLFKNWQAHYIASMLEYTGEGVMRGNWNPLAWQMGGTASMAGVAGLPMYAAADAFSEWASDESLMEHIYGAFNGDPDSVGGGISDAIYMGLPSLMGVSLSGQTAAPFSDPSRDASMLFSFVQADRAKAIGNFAGAAMDKWQTTGEHPINSPEVRDKFVAAFMPKVIARAAAVTEDGAIKSLNTGNQQIGKLNLAESMMYQAGLMPRRVALAHEVNENLWQNQKKKQAKVANMGKAWMEAEQAGDTEMLFQLQSQSMREGVDISSIIKSAKIRTEKQQNPRLNRQYDPEELIGFMRKGIIK